MTETTQKKRASVFNLPGWSCPGRVADIPTHVGSYGWVPAIAVGIDPQGGLYVTGNTTPVAAPDRWPSVYVGWTESGLAIHVPRRWYARIGDGRAPITARGREYSDPPRVPVTHVLTRLPAHAAMHEPVAQGQPPRWALALAARRRHRMIRAGTA